MKLGCQMSKYPTGHPLGFQEPLFRIDVTFEMRTVLREIHLLNDTI